MESFKTAPLLHLLHRDSKPLMVEVTVVAETAAEGNQVATNPIRTVVVVVATALVNTRVQTKLI